MKVFDGHLEKCCGVPLKKRKLWPVFYYRRHVLTKCLVTLLHRIKIQVCSEARIFSYIQLQWCNSCMYCNASPTHRKKKSTVWYKAARVSLTWTIDFFYTHSLLKLQYHDFLLVSIKRYFIFHAGNNGSCSMDTGTSLKFSMKNCLSVYGWPTGNT